jgi:hypothetical protein
MNKTMVRLVHYEDSKRLAYTIAESAPLQYTGFAIRKLDKQCVSVMYSKGIDNEFLSLQKLRDELGIAEPLPEKIERKRFFIETFEAMQRGQQGFILLKQGR